MILSSKRLLFQFAFDISKVIPQIPKAFLDQPIFTFLFFFVQEDLSKEIQNLRAEIKVKEQRYLHCIILYYPFMTIWTIP